MYGILSLSASIQIHASSGKTLTRSIDTPARPALTTNACLEYFALLTYDIYVYWHLFFRFFDDYERDEDGNYVVNSAGNVWDDHDHGEVSR